MNPDGVGRDHTLLSPEQVSLSLPISGPGPRILAYAIDYVILILLQIALIVSFMLLLPFLGETVQGLADWVSESFENVDEETPEEYLRGAILMWFMVLFVLQMISEWLYFIALEMMTNGQSIGKRFIKLRVVREGGRPITFRASLTRNLMRIVDVLPGQYLVGLITMILSNESRRLGDMAAETLVVRLDQPMAAAPIAPLSPDEDGRFAFDADMLSRVGRDELRLARATVRRVPDMPPPLAKQALERAVSTLSTRIGYEHIAEREHELFLRALIAAAERL